MESMFLDTSALAKRYVDETGSEWISELFVSDEKVSVYIAELTSVELTSAIIRRSKGGYITSDEATAILNEFDSHLIRDYFVLEISPELLFEARLLVIKHGLRAYDAVQLAIAEFFNRGQIERNLAAVTFVSADNELLTAARADGLLTDNPNNYP